MITPAGSVVSIIVSARQIPKVRCVLVANPRVTAVVEKTLVGGPNPSGVKGVHYRLLLLRVKAIPVMVNSPDR